MASGSRDLRIDLWTKVWADTDASLSSKWYRLVVDYNNFLQKFRNSRLDR
jgi:hypothetical protein